MSILPSVFSVLLSAVLLSAGIPNEYLKLGSVLLGLFSLVPLYFAFLGTKRWFVSGFLGGLMMMTVHLLSSFWLANFKEYALLTLGGSAMVNFCFGFLAGLLLKHALSFPIHIRPFVFAAVWMIWEWFKSIGFLAYPWGTLVMTSRELFPLIQIADITGTWGISFLFALVSAIAAETLIAVRARSKLFTPSATFTLFLLALACVYGIFRIAVQPRPETTLNVVMVQQNTDSWDEGGFKKAILDSEKLTRAAIARSGKKPDLVVWSESTLAYPYLENREYYKVFPPEDPFGPFLSGIGAPLLVGSPVLVNPKTKDYSNAVILLSPSGDQLDWYAKIQLVPFAEYMPFTEYKWVRDFYQSLAGFSSGWIPGNRLEPLSVKNGEGRTINFTAPICFEDAFSSLIARLHNKGSNLLVNLTNDSWSKTDSAEYQHFVIASFRTIELRTTMIRSTNAGYSVVINPLGKVITDMPLFVPDSLQVAVPIYTHQTTFYARFGDWFPALISVILLALFASRAVVDKRRQNS